MEIGVITNPNSRKNRNRPDRAERLQRVLGSVGEVHKTESIASIKPVLRDFLRKRARYWVADGGDGALHWMLRMGMEVLQEDEFAGKSFQLPVTLPTKGGTIDFVANNVGITGDAEGILASLRSSVELGSAIEETEVDSMAIDGIQIIDGVEVPFRTYGFASAAGGIGQRFYSKYYAHEDPNPRTIMKVVANTVMSAPISLTPLSKLPSFGNLGTFAKEIFEPTKCRILLDGMRLPGDTFTGVHVASMSINLGNVLRFFGKADQPGLMNAIVGTPSPWTIIKNIPRMARGDEMKGRNILDRPCREMVLEAAGGELLAPVIDGEYYRNVARIAFHVGPRVRIPKVVAAKAAAA
jgi:diacylglycerol kinase family enzyme